MSDDQANPNGIITKPAPSRLTALDDANGGADLTLVTRRTSAPGTRPTPHCALHGAMNKVSEEGIWRCITTAGPSGNGCRAACLEVVTTPTSPCPTPRF